MGFIKDLNEGAIKFVGYDIITMTDIYTNVYRDGSVRSECVTTSFGVNIRPTKIISVDEARRDINDILLHLREKYGNSQMFGTPNCNYFRIIADGHPDMAILVPEKNMANQEEIETYDLLKDRLIENIYLDFSYDVKGNCDGERIKTIAHINCTKQSGVEGTE